MKLRWVVERARTRQHSKAGRGSCHLETRVRTAFKQYPLAVGLGGSVGRGKDKMDGWVYIYDGDTNKSGWEVLEPAFTMHHAKGWISDLKFSPDGQTLACASHDNMIYLLDTDGWRQYAVLSGHSSYVSHVDWCVAHSFRFCRWH